MSWQIGYDEKWKRDIGYGVPALCDHPGCNKEIDRGLAYVCCGSEPYGGDDGCGLYFCEEHNFYSDDTEHRRCERCNAGKEPFTPKPDIAEWINFKLTDESWAEWREENPDWVKANSTPSASERTETPT
jgi:hypothetical protein